MQTTPATANLYRDFATQAEIDRQYNPSLGLADTTAPGRHYAALAERARGLLPQHLDIPFGPTRAETLDIFPAIPTGPGGAPVFVFIHGGYWRALSSKDFSGVALGLHARASAKLTKLAGSFSCEVWLTRGERRVNGKSIMGVMMLAAGIGSEVIVETIGPDADQALAALLALIADKFGEGE